MAEFTMQGSGYQLHFNARLQRTPSGSPTADARKKHGIRSGPNQGKLPINDKKSAINALRLMHSLKPPLTIKEKEQVIRRAREFAPNEATDALKKLHDKS